MLCQLECASEVESGLGETLDWVLKWLVNLIAGKTQLVSFYQSNSSCATDVKIGGSVLQKTCLFCDSNCLFLLSCTRAFRLSLLLQPPSRNLEPWFVLWSFFLLRLLFIPVNLQYGLACNAIVRSGLVLLPTNGLCYINCKNIYVELLALNLLHLLKPWLITEMEPV